MAIGYTELDFVNGSAPALSAANLNHIDEALKDACDLLDAETVAGRALVEAADADAQRTALELGNSATLDVGTGAGDVAAGNAPAGAVTTHESTYAHANLPTAAGKTAADAIGAASGADTGAKIKTLVGDASTSNKGVTLLAADGGTTAGTVVQANDSRLAKAPIAWTPVPKFGGEADDGTYVVSLNKLFQSGKLSLIEAMITWSLKGTKTGVFLLGGVPVAPASAAAALGGSAPYMANMNGITAKTGLTANIASGGIYFCEQDITGTKTNALNDSHFTATSVIRIRCMYISA